MSKKLLMNNYFENGLMPVMDGLICWLDGRDGKNGDIIWKDRSGNNNHATLQGFTTNGNNGFMNGIIKMDRDTKIILPTPLNFTTFQCVFKEDGTDAQIDIIGTNPRTFRFCLRASDKHPYYANIEDVAVNDNNSMKENNGDNVIGYSHAHFESSVHMKNKFLHLECSTNLHSNTTIGYDTNSGAKTEFSAILIYDRPLSKDERLHNYLYIQSIERG